MILTLKAKRQITDCTLLFYYHECIVLDKSRKLVRISFDPKKDKDFLNRRVIPLVRRLAGNEISYESEKRIAFWNKNFVKFLENDCGIKPGSKFVHNWPISNWCFKRKDYLCAVLRGLFDTDGYFGYWGGSVYLMFGRFSDRCIGLTNDIMIGLNQLGFEPTFRHTPDGRFTITLTDSVSIIRFFKTVGTSNIKHVVRFILWRTKKKEAKIEKEGLETLINEVKELGVDTPFDLPWFWKVEINKELANYVADDDRFLKGSELRITYNWDSLVAHLVENKGNKALAKTLSVTGRSIRRWREGTRLPSYKYVPVLLEMLEDSGINPENYKSQKAF